MSKFSSMLTWRSVYFAKNTKIMRKKSRFPSPSFVICQSKQPKVVFPPSPDCPQCPHDCSHFADYLFDMFAILKSPSYLSMVELDVEDSGQLGAAALDSDKQKPISIMNYKCPISWHPTLGTWPRWRLVPEHNWEHFSNSFLFTSFYSVTKHKKLLPVKSFAFQIIELNQAGLGWAGLGWLGMTALERTVCGAH